MGDETCQSDGEGLLTVGAEDLRFRRSIIKTGGGGGISKAVLRRGIAACRAFSRRAINKTLLKRGDDELSRADASRRVT